MSTKQWICYLYRLMLGIIDVQSRTPKTFYGDERPANDLGDEGDLYIRFKGGRIYEKDSERWKLKGSIYYANVDGGEAE